MSSKILTVLPLVFHLAVGTAAAGIAVAPRTPDQEVISTGVGEARAIFALDGSQHAVFVVKDRRGARLVSGDSTSETFDEILEPSVFALSEGRFVFAARRGGQYFVVWTGGESEPLAQQPGVRASADGKAWIALGQRSDGQQVAYLNGAMLGPYERVESSKGFGFCGIERGPIYAVGIKSVKASEVDVHLCGGSRTVKAPRPLQNSSHAPWLLVASDGRRIAVVRDMQLEIDGRTKSLAVRDATSLEARLGPGGATLAILRGKIGRAEMRPLEVHFTGGARYAVPREPLTSMQLGDAAFSSDGSDFLLPYQVGLSGEGGAYAGILTRSGPIMGAEAGVRGISDLSYLAGRPFFIGQIVSRKSRIFWDGKPVSPEFDTGEPIWLFSEDGRHFVADLDPKSSQERSIILDGEEHLVKGSGRGLAIAPAGQAAAVVVGRDSTTFLIRIDAGGKPVEMPIERGVAITRPEFSPDGSRLAIGFQRGASSGVLLDGREVSPEPLPQLLHFLEDGSATAEARRDRPGRSLFFSPDSAVLAFFTGLPDDATLHLGGQRLPASFRPIGLPRFSAAGTFEFMARKDDSVVLVRVDPKSIAAEAAAAAASAPAESPRTSAAPIRTSGEYDAVARNAEVASRSDVKEVFGFTAVGSRIVLARRAGSVQRGDERFGQRDVEVVEAYFDGQVLAQADRIQQAIVSADGTKAAFAMSDDGGATTYFVLDGKRFGGKDRGSKVWGGALSRDGRSIAYWIVKGTPIAGEIALMHDDRVVHATKLSDKLFLDAANRLFPAVLSDDGQRIAGFVPLMKRGREPATLLVLDDSTHEVPAPVLADGRPCAGFLGPDRGRFVALVGSRSRPQFWTEGSGLSRALRQLAGEAVFSASSGRFAIAAPELHDSAAEGDGIDSPVLEGTVVMGPVLSPDGRKLVCAISDGSGAPQRLVIDGKVGVRARRFSPAVFSADGRRMVYGFEALEAPAKRVDFSDLSRGAYRIDVDGALLELDGFPERVGFSPDGRQVWAVCVRQGSQGFERQVVVNGTPGPTFESVGDVAFNADGTAFAYHVVKRGRSALVVNHEEVASFDEAAGRTWPERGDPRRDAVAALALGTDARSQPSFVDNRTVVMHAFDGDRLERIEVALAGELPPIPSLDAAPRARAATAKPLGSEEPPEEPSEDDASISEQPDLDQEASQLHKSIVKALGDAVKAAGNGGGVIPGLGEGGPDPDAAPKSAEPAKRPGRAAKSAEVEKFVGQWNVVLKAPDGKELKDVLRVSKDGTLISDHAIDFDIETVDYEVRSEDGVLRLYARSVQERFTFDWLLELKGNEVKVIFEQTSGARSRKYDGKGSR